MYPIDFFFRAAQAWPSNPALLEPDNQTVTYAQLAKRVRALACYLQVCDPQPGSRVGLCGQNSADYVVAMLAIMAAGKVWVPLNTRSTAHEVGRILETVQTSLVIVDEAGAELVSPRDQQTILSMVDLPEATRSYLDQAPVRYDADQNDTQAIKFTGGTTGLPKGVMQPYRAWVAVIVNQIACWQITAADRYVAGAPLSHGSGTYVLPTLAQGAAIVLVDANDPEGLIKAFRDQGGTMTFMPPTLIYKLMQTPGASRASFPALRLMIYGGAPMPSSKIEAAQAFFGPVLATTFGQTEAPQIATCITPDALMDPQTRDSVGRLTWFTEIKIVSPDGEVLPVGEKGEVLIRGDLVMTGYWKQPEVTATTIRDGWLHTGDVGYLDERGYLFLKERLRDVIISGGFNVYPVDVENVLSQHEAVHEAAVFGLPDEQWGETVNAAVELKPGATVDETELKAFVREKVGPVLTPKKIWFCESLPRSPVGKVLKTEIRRQYQTN
ncbi:class I adenylate-forming enzyme family protein [Orrella sp. 11846]|uniref:class I adenylate-forming enzyme family protein n=1 Tax=Orrella sp. 11846 TaxID=3409913 RepID=UPI003B58DCA4